MSVASNDAELEPKKPAKLANIVKICGFEEDDYESSDGEKELEPVQVLVEKKKRRGGKKNRKRQNAFLRFQHQQQQQQLQQSQDQDYNSKSAPPLKLESFFPVEKPQQQQQQQQQQQPNVKLSRLMKEIHDRERVTGMDRIDARQLLYDKMMFLEDIDMSKIRLRRFCIVIISREEFELGNDSRIPAETISISIENGKISSILKIVPTARLDEEVVESGKDKYRMKTVYWNPTNMQESNSMYKVWSHFLERCLHSLLIVPLAQHRSVITFLRKINEIRSMLNNRQTLSICLSRVISLEDFMMTIQKVAEAYVHVEDTPQRKNLKPVDYALEICHYFIGSMKYVATIEKANRLKISQEKPTGPAQLLHGPPPGLSGELLKTMNQPLMGTEASSPSAPTSPPQPLMSVQPPQPPPPPQQSSTMCFSPPSPFYENAGTIFSPNAFPPYSNLAQQAVRTPFEPTPNPLKNWSYMSSEVQSYQRIFRWLDSVNLAEMCTGEELEDKYDAIRMESLQEQETGEDFVGFDHID